MADLSVTAASVVPVAGCTTQYGFAGETLTAGQAIYAKADGTIWKAQADGTVAEATAIGVTLNGAAAGQTVGYVTDGAMNIGATTVKTSAYMLSAAAGAICPQADLVSTNKITYMGYATATDGSFVVRIRYTGAVV